MHLLASSRRRTGSVLAAFAFVSAGSLAARAQAPGGETPPPSVTVETLKTQDVPVTYEYAGRVAASREVQVRARVGGILLSREFDEGSTVTKGEQLFRIDPASYEAEVQGAQAQVQEAQANLNQARRSEGRAAQLAQQGASSQANLDDAVSARELAEAQLAAAEASLRSARLSLDYATVEAPAGGITSLEQVPEGSLLNTGDLLTRITQLDPIYVNFSAADTEAASIRDLIQSGSLSGSRGTDGLTVSVLFGGGQAYERDGFIDFTSTSIDQQTGTILSRAVLPNPESELLPGQFVRLQVEGLSIDDAVTIPTEALMQGPQGTFVYVIDENDVASVRPVEVGRQLEDRLVISSGLKAGDRVVTRGVIKVRPGSPVAPADPDAATPEGEQPAAEANTPAAANDSGEATDTEQAAQADAEGAPDREAVEVEQPMRSDASEDDGASAAPRAEGSSTPDRTGANDAPGGAQYAALERSERAVSPKTDASAGPPVPLSALPDGEAARRATRGGGDREGIVQ